MKNSAQAEKTSASKDPAITDSLRQQRRYQVQRNRGQARFRVSYREGTTPPEQCLFCKD